MKSYGEGRGFLFKKLLMEFLEKHLEQIILESNIEELEQRGLDIFHKNTKIKSQLKIGNYGIADIIAYNKPSRFFRGLIKVIELKKDKLDINGFLQAVRYLTGIKSYLDKRGILDDYDFNITLIGSEVAQTDFCYLSKAFDDTWGCLDKEAIFGNSTSVEMYTYNYKIDGIYFKKEQYILKDEGF